MTCSFRLLKIIRRCLLGLTPLTLSLIEGDYPMGTHAITGARVSCLLLTMNNNAIPQTRGSAIASTLAYSLLGSPFPAADNEISNPEPAPVCATPQDSIEASEQVLKVVGFGEITAANCHLFRKTACAAWKGHTDVEIDLSHTAIIDCAGLGALIAVRNLTCKRKGVARLMNPTPPVQQLLDLTRTGLLFDIVIAPDADFLILGLVAQN